MTVTRRPLQGAAIPSARLSEQAWNRKLCYRTQATLLEGKMISNRPIGVAGAGSIGCFVGGMYAVSGRRVALLARPRVIEEIEGNGLRLTGFGNFERNIAADALTLSEDSRISADAVIVSLQNGVGNVAVLREKLPGRRVLAAMVPFNVIALGDGRFHRATSGDIIIERDDGGTAQQLSVPGLRMLATDDIAGVQWGKLLVNLFNALNALADVPLRQQLAQRSWRRLFADQMAEGLSAIRAAGIKPVSPTPVPASLTPPLLRLPDAMFGILLGRTMKIDPEARSSMWEDLQRGRRTEIDYLQGVITGIADRYGLQVPLSRRVVALIKSAEASGKGSPGLTPEQIRA